MKIHSAAAILAIVVFCGLSGRPLLASIAGGTNVSTEYNADVRGANGAEQYRFNITIEPMMFRLQTMQGKYRLVRLRVWNATTSPMALSADNDRLELLPRGAPAVAAVLNPQRLDPTFWNALDANTRETLAYPVTLKGTPVPASGTRPPSPESLYIYVLVPAAQVGEAPESFRYTIASLNQTIVIRTAGGKGGIATAMFSGFWNAFVKYIEKQPYWEAIQPFFLVIVGTVVAEVMAYQYVKAQYNLTQVPLFLASYLSTRILVSSAAVLLLLLLFKIDPGRRKRPEPGRLVALYRTHRTTILYRGLLTAVVAVATGFVFFATSPTRVSHITIRLMDLPADVRSDAFTYLVYEMNRMQRQWYFEIDSRPFNPSALTSDEYNACNPEGDDQAQPLLCYAERKTESQGPLIAITAMPLNNVYFATHRGTASVITTADAASVAPITNYEYLAYMTVLQSMLIQLDAHGTSPVDAFVPGATSGGGTFEFAPARDMFKPAMLAPRLGPAQEALIFNRFGPAYLGVCSQLLSLDWLYAPRVRENLSKLFGVTLSH